MRLSRSRALAGMLALALSACGYSTGLHVSERFGSVGVEFFGNETLERDLERQFSDEMTVALRNWSEAPLVDPRRADTVVRGTIREYHRRSGIRNTQNQLLETGIYLEVEASLYKAGSGMLQRGPVQAKAWVGYIVGPDENERVARDQAMKKVAEELVLDLFAPLG